MAISNKVGFCLGELEVQFNVAISNYLGSCHSQFEAKFTGAISDLVGFSGVYCLFGGLFTLHCGHNTQVSSMKNTWYLLNFILPIKLELGSSYYLTLRRMVYMLISNVST